MVYLTKSSKFYHSPIYLSFSLWLVLIMYCMKKSLLTTETYFPMLSSRNVIVSPFIYRSTVLWNFYILCEVGIKIFFPLELEPPLEVKVLVAQSCLILCDPMDYSPLGSSVHGILQARILEWVAIFFSRNLPDPGIELGSPALQADSLSSEPPK